MKRHPTDAKDTWRFYRAAKNTAIPAAETATLIAIVLAFTVQRKSTFKKA